MAQKLAELVAAMNSQDPARRADAAERLSQLGEGARAVAVELVKCCSETTDEVRELVVAALESLGPPAPDDVAPLISLLGDGCPDVVYWSATLLGRLRGEARAAIDELADIVGSAATEQAARERAAWALGEIGLSAKARGVLQQLSTNGPPRLARLAKAALEAHPNERR